MYVQYITLVLLTTGAALADLRGGRVPNSVIASGLLCGAAGSVFDRGLSGLLLCTGGAALPLLLLAPLWYFHMIGAGDIKLLSMAGAFCGPAASFRILIYTFLIGGIFSFVLLIRRGTFHSRFHYFLSYIKSLDGKRVPSYLDGVSEDGRFCFALPILCGVLWEMLPGSAEILPF